MRWLYHGITTRTYLTTYANIWRVLLKVMNNHFNQKKIIHVAPTYYLGFGGVPVVVQNIAEGQAKRGYNVEIITSKTKNKSRDEYINNVYVRRFKKIFGDFYFPGIKFIMAIRKIRNSIIHVHAFHNFISFFAILIAHRSNITIFNTHFHGKSSKSYRNPLLKLYLMLFNFIIKFVKVQRSII